MIPLSEEQFPFPVPELARLKNRRWILRYFPKDSVGIEIGVFRGHFSEVIAETVSPKRMYLVDPWTRLGETFGWGKEYTSFNQLPTRVAKEEAIARMQKFPSLDFVIVEDFSERFLPTFTGTVDWVYLDSSHDYKETYQELQLIDRILKKGGSIAGDDWQPRVHQKHHGVFRAVNDFVKRYDYQFLAAGPAGQWCIRRAPNYGEIDRRLALDI